jgi:ABC-type sugar transport system permease subunit
MTRRLPGLIWAAPALLVLAALSIYPLLYLIKVSLTDAHGLTISHYARLFHDRLFAVRSRSSSFSDWRWLCWWTRWREAAR